jgi:uncharacterized protein (TIGR02996 family)
MTTLEGLLNAIVADPHNEVRWLVLADYLDEYDDPRRAELLRLHRRLLATCCEPDQHPERVGWHARIIELLAERVPPCLPEQTVELDRGVEMKFSFIPPGTFLMGTPAGEEHPWPGEGAPHRVTLTQGFFLGIYPVTQAQWQRVMGENFHSYFRQRSGKEPGFLASLFRVRTIPADDPQNDEQHPECVSWHQPEECVSWEECRKFCNRLGKRSRKRFRLPTEAEWEYACRACTNTEYHSGNGEEALKREGWYGDNSGHKGHPVGRKNANAFGLYDMHGNVWEWCQDGMREYTLGDITDPKGPEGKDDARVARGGSWAAVRSGARAACRTFDPPSFRAPWLGCRVVLCLDES